MGDRARKRSATLRDTLALVTAAIGILAVGASAALVILSSYLHRASETLADGVESVRLAEALEIDLLLHARAKDDVVRAALEEQMTSRLVEASRYAGTSDEVRALTDATARVNEYLATGDRASAAELHDPAYDALHALVEVTVREAHRARQDVARWDRLANTIGLSMTAALTVLSAVLIWWLRTRAFAPILGLARAMQRFGKGDTAARAEERGLAEVREMAERFNQVAEALAAQRSAQMSFLAGVAHDLRTPLSVLSVSLGTMSLERTLPPEAKQRRTLETMKRQLARLDRMVSDLLDTTRIEAGHLELRLDKRDVHALVAEVVETFAATTQDHRIRLSDARGVVLVRCDPVRIEQVVGNLLANAMKYSPVGRDVEVTVEAVGGEAVVTVTDHGIGISSADQERLFEPFRRVGLAKETIPGVGLGLFVVRRIVEAHGGRIEVHSVPGQGSRFTVRLPLCSGDPASEPAPVLH